MITKGYKNYLILNLSDTNVTTSATVVNLFLYFMLMIKLQMIVLPQRCDDSLDHCLNWTISNITVDYVYIIYM